MEQKIFSGLALAALLTACAATPEEADLSDDSPGTVDPMSPDLPDLDLGDLILPPSRPPPIADCDPRSVGASATHQLPEGTIGRWARFSPDATELALQLQKPGTLQELGVMSTCTGELSIMVEGVRHQTAPVWSPDGTTVYFPVTHHFDDAFFFAVDRFEGETTRLFHAYGAMTPDVAPDGRSLLYAINGGNLFVADLAGSIGPRNLGHAGEAPRFSPDGKRVLFVARLGGANLEVREMELSSNTTRVVATGQSIVTPASLDYFPDGSILLSTDSGVERIDPQGVRQVVHEKPGMVDVAEDGSLIAITEPDRVVILASL